MKETPKRNQNTDASDRMTIQLNGKKWAIKVSEWPTIRSPGAREDCNALIDFETNEIVLGDDGTAWGLLHRLIAVVNDFANGHKGSEFKDIG